MKSIVTIIIFFFGNICFAQQKNINGTYSNSVVLPSVTVIFNADSTFSYRSLLSPNPFNLNEFFEKGTWSRKLDTLILNPKLEKKSFGSYEMVEGASINLSKLEINVRLINQYFDKSGSLVKRDTARIKQFDFALNDNSKKNRFRVAEKPTTRCAFAGFIPKEIITTENTISLEKPKVKLEKIYVGCYEIGGTKEFAITNPNSNQLTLNVYSNFYEDGQIRQVKYLIKNDETIFIKQKADGKFQEDGLHIDELVIRKQRELLSK